MKSSMKIILQGIKHSIDTNLNQLEKRIKELEETGASKEQIEKAVEDYLKENNISADVYMRVSEGYIQFSDDNENWENVIALSELKGDPGQSGVYVGSGEMPEGCNVQIDPDAEGEELVTKQYVDGLFAEYIEEVAALVGGDA